MIARVRRLFAPAGGQAGLTLVELVFAALTMSVVIAAMSTLVGAAIRSKMIVAVRAADTETARQTLEWMSERLRNAGLNTLPSVQPVRCQDMVVAQDAALRPTSGQFYVSGEILNSNVIPGDQVIVLGYRLSGGTVVEDTGNCSGAWAPTVATVSNPRVTVTGLGFRYFERNGAEVVVPTTDVNAIRNIRLVHITITVQAEEGRSGAQVQTFTRFVMLRNPRPDSNNWLSP